MKEEKYTLLIDQDDVLAEYIQGVTDAYNEKYLPFFPIDRVIICKRKSVIKGDFLLDDGMHNIEEFERLIMQYCYPEQVLHDMDEAAI